MRILVVSTVTLLLLADVLLTGAAFAQEHINSAVAAKDAAAMNAAKERKKRQELDATYEEMLAKDKAKARPAADPWGNVRAPANTPAASR